MHRYYSFIFAWLKILFKSARREIISRVRGNGDPAGFYRMFILAMIFFCCYEVPLFYFNGSGYSISTTGQDAPAAAESFLSAVTSVASQRTDAAIKRAS